MSIKKVKLNKAAKARLQQLREEYTECKEKGDTERISQLLYMAESIKKGETNFVYDYDRFFK